MILLSKIAGMLAGDLGLGAVTICADNKSGDMCGHFLSPPPFPWGEDSGLAPSISLPHLHPHSKVVLISCSILGLR